MFNKSTPVLPQRAPSTEEPVPSYLTPDNGAAFNGDWVFDKETGSFVWYPKDKLGQSLNSSQPILQELKEKVPVLPRPAQIFEDGSTYVTPKQ